MVSSLRNLRRSRSGRTVPDLESLLDRPTRLLGLAFERELSIRARVRSAREPAPQVFPDVASQKDRRARAPVLADVRQLVGEKRHGLGRVRGDERRRLCREVDPPPEDDRVGARDRGQEAGEKSSMEPGAAELAGEVGAQASRQGGRDPGSQQATIRRGSFGATRSASAPLCR